MTDSRLRLSRLAALVVLVAVAGLVVGSKTWHGRLAEAVTWGQAIIAQSPTAGMAVFVALSALSAMFAFFSTGLLAPVAIAAWGIPVTLGLLWLGWLLGGAATYAVGRVIGRSAAGLFVDDATLAVWEAQVTRRARLSHVLLFQLAMPSEIPGYVLGLVRYSFATYLGVLAVTEIPYVFAVVYLGESFLEGNAATFVSIGIVTVAVSAGVYHFIRRDLESRS